MTFYNQHSTALVGAAGQPQGHFLEDSLRLRSSASAYLNRTPTSTGNRKTWTWSGWVKRSKLNAFNPLFQANHSGVPWFVLGFANNDKIEVTQTAGSSASWESTAVFRDVSAWYHVVLVVDTTSATSTMAGSSTDRFRLYVNGVQYVITGGTVPTQNSDLQVNNTVAHTIGGYSTNMTDGYLTEVNFIDGQALDPSYFGETDTVTGVWKPIEYTGSYGTNGFYLPMTPTSQAEGFNTVLYKGTGATQSITGVGFAPDLVWAKNRAAASHGIYDSVRGTGIYLASNLTTADTVDANSLTAFNADGFSLGSTTRSNTSGDNYVAWCWDAGSSSPASNTDGSITSTVKANQAKGFSIVSYTGTGSNATVGHGLGTSPSMIIVKNRAVSSNWYVGHDGVNPTLPWSYRMILQDVDARTNDGAAWNDTAPTSSVFSIGTSGATNGSGNAMIAYCFSEVAGYSKIGSYTGNGSSTGPVITTGFRPAFVMFKVTSTTASWVINDSIRNPYNTADKYLIPNNSNAEGTLATVDFTSNGFQLRTADSSWNQSGQTYIYMAFADTRDTAFNNDASGNKNNWTPNNINSNASGQSTYDLMKDVPTLTSASAGNFCTLNPLSTAGGTFSNGNLDWSSPNATDARLCLATIPVNNFNCYCEVTIGSFSGNSQVGVFGSATAFNPRVMYRNDGARWIDGTQQSGNWSSFTTNDIIGITYNASTGSVSFYKNNTLQGSMTVSNTNTTQYFAAGSNSTGTANYTFNFGQRPFAYTPPSGYKALNTYNLPTPTIADGSKYFDIRLRTGTGSQVTVTGLGFRPDLLWTKTRSNVVNHNVAGTGLTYDYSFLQTNTTNTENTGASHYYMTPTSDGYIVGTGDNINQNTYTFVDWLWKANGSGVSNTDGSITSTVSANTSSGFSVVTFTSPGGSAPTIGHGLGTTPSLIIMKSRNNASGWNTYHASVGNTGSLNLQTTGATSTSVDWWNNTSPTASVWTIGANLNISSWTWVAYCFAPIEGYSAFGSYTGNGSTDGPFVYTGFRPAFILFKCNLAGAHWVIFDVARNTYNLTDRYLQPNTANAEATTYPKIDILSNGFKCRNANDDINYSGYDTIYAAFAENPFKYSLAR